MTSSKLRLSIAGAIILAAGSTAWADDAPAADPGVDVTGFVDGYYSYNFNDPQSRTNALHTYDVDHNSLSLSLIEVAFEKKPAEGSPVGFRADLNFGPSAEITNAFEPSSYKDALKHLEQGYVSWLASPKVQFDFGKFVTPIGAEVIESKDNWNYTRSTQFGWAIPFYHSGLRATITGSDKFTFAAYLVNGWNSVTDNNNAKSGIVQLTFKPSGKVTWIVNGMAGKESSDEDGDTRLLFDTVLSFAASDKLSLMANVDYGDEGDLGSWTAAAIYAKFQASPNFALSPRFEWMDDEDGWATIGTNVMSATLTGDFKVGGGITARVDLRHDWADDEIFVKSYSTAEDGTITPTELKDGQTTLTVGLVYAFGGKI